MLFVSSPANPWSMRCDDLGRAVLLFASGFRNWLSSAGALFPMARLDVVSPPVLRVRVSRARFCEDAGDASSDEGALLCLELPLPAGVSKRDVGTLANGEEWLEALASSCAIEMR